MTFLATGGLLRNFVPLVEESGDTFPRLGISAIGGWGTVGLDAKPGGMPGRMARIAMHDVANIQPWREWSYSGSTGPAKDRTDICDYLRSFNPNIVLYCYTLGTNDLYNSSQLEPSPTMRNKWDTEKWYLYDGTGNTFPDDVVVPGGAFPDWQGNASVYVGVDGAGVSPTQWLARAEHANSDDVGGDWITSGKGLRSEYGFDGIYQDIMRHEPREAGDWNVDGSVDGSRSAIVLDANAGAHHAYHAEWDVLEPTFLHGGNYTHNTSPNNDVGEFADTLAAGYRNFVNLIQIEGIMGRSISVETFAGWDAMMRQYKRGMYLIDGMDPQHCFFDNWETDGHSESDPNIWDTTHSLYDWGRYGLCSCLQDNGYYGFPTSGGFVDANILDEYSFDLGAAIDAPNYDGNDPATATTGSGYLPYENGVYLREFANGLAIVNPKGNGTQTITLPSPGAGFHWERLDAADYDNQDPTTNDGAIVTTQQLPERHGIIIKRVASAESFPRTGLYSQGFWSPTGLDSKGGLFARLSRMAKYKYCIFGNVRAWTYDGIDGGIYRVRDLPTLTKSFSTVNTKCFMYVKSVEVSRASTADQYEKIRAKCASEVGPNGDWYLRNFQDCHVSSFPVKGPDCAEIASTWRTNHSELTTPDSRGLRVPDWTARLDHYDERYGDDPGDWASNGDGIHSEDGWEGIFIDVMAATGKVGADWDGDGVDEDKEGQQVIDWVTIGHVNHVNAWRALEPDFIICGNFASNASQIARYNLVPPRFYDFIDGPNSEFMMGESHASEEWATNEDEVMGYMKRIMSFNAVSRAAGAQTYELFDAKNTTKPAGVSDADWTRYGLCICLQDDMWYSGTDLVTLAGFPLICNEFDYNLGQSAGPPDYGATASGYNSYENGVYLRKFEFGYALFNPKNNGQQTITLPVEAGYRIDRLGAADFPDPVENPSVNDGATNILTQTLEPRTGIILKRVKL
jgi:hypothetical protein